MVRQRYHLDFRVHYGGKQRCGVLDQHRLRCAGLSCLNKRSYIKLFFVTVTNCTLFFQSFHLVALLALEPATASNQFFGALFRGPRNCRGSVPVRLASVGPANRCKADVINLDLQKILWSLSTFANLFCSFGRYTTTYSTPHSLSILLLLLQHPIEIYTDWKCNLAPQFESQSPRDSCCRRKYADGRSEHRHPVRSPAALIPSHLDRDSQGRLYRENAANGRHCCARG